MTTQDGHTHAQAYKQWKQQSRRQKETAYRSMFFLSSSCLFLLLVSVNGNGQNPIAAACWVDIKAGGKQQKKNNKIKAINAFDYIVAKSIDFGKNADINQNN